MITITKLTNFLILISPVDGAAENLPCQSRADTWKSRLCVTSPPLNSQCRGMHQFLYLSYCLRGWKKSIHSLKPTLAKPPSHTWLDFPIQEERLWSCYTTVDLAFVSSSGRVSCWFQSFGFMSIVLVYVNLVPAGAAWLIRLFWARFVSRNLPQFGLNSVRMTNTLCI